MEREQLLKSLQELEKQLIGVKTATEQVNSVLAADKALADAVQQYTEKADGLVNSLKDQYSSGINSVRESAISALQNSSDQFKASVETVEQQIHGHVQSLTDVVEGTLAPLVNSDLKNVSGEIKTSSKEATDALKNAIAESAVKLEDLSKVFSEKTEKVLTSLKESSDFVSKIPELFKTSSDEISRSISSAIENNSQLLSSLKEINAEMLNKILIDVNVSQQAAEDTKKAVESINKFITTSEEEYLKLELSLEEQQKSINAVEKAISKTIEKQAGEIAGLKKLNIIILVIMVVGFVAVAALKFI